MVKKETQAERAKRLFPKDTTPKGYDAPAVVNRDVHTGPRTDQLGKTPTDYKKQTYSIAGSADGNVPQRDFTDIKEYEKAKREMGTSLDPKVIAADPLNQIRQDPSQFGLLRPGEQAIDPGTIDITTQQNERTFLEKQGLIAKGETSLIDTPSTMDLFSDKTAGAIAIGAVVAAAGALGWTIAAGTGTAAVATTPLKAVQLGTAVKNSIGARALGGKIFTWAVGGYAALKAGEGVAGYFTGRQIDEQQAAVNTIGQMATTIGGDSTEAAGDWRKGLQELNYLKSQVLYLESAIKSGQISSAAVKFNGKIYDINADMADQLATIDEQITIINSFVLSNSFPELSDLEIQGRLRQLEDEGIIKPKDFTTSRRPVQ
jgi:hypothetical protein